MPFIRFSRDVTIMTGERPVMTSEIIADIRARRGAGQSCGTIGREMRISRHTVERVARELGFYTPIQRPVMVKNDKPDRTEREKAGLAPLPAFHPIAMMVLLGEVKE